MHLVMILVAVIIACWIRNQGYQPQGSWIIRWQRSLFLFLFPPLLILMTAVALVSMGPQGRMGQWQVSWSGYVFALIWLLLFTCVFIRLAWQGWQSLNSTRKCSQIALDGKPTRLLPTSAIFAGQIGFWHPELVISQGMINALSPEHLQTVIAHEQGHYHYHDTFWFFWLGWIRCCTRWLPNTESLWQELLILREIRADAHAALQVDPLLLAESLLLVVSETFDTSNIVCAALGSSGSDRLEQRIDALLSPTSSQFRIGWESWQKFLWVLLPLATVIFHT
ncbi:MAG: M56 family metallopeptidase [Richelia sp.]|nr:M56 family metallopeptidase [Richelia sp.]